MGKHFTMTAFAKSNNDRIYTNDMNQIEVWDDDDLGGPAIQLHTPEQTIALDYYATIQLYSLLKKHEKLLSKKVIVVK